ncbi:serine/threonine protein kinase [Phormidium sp. CCY1219]|uniref:serine/threonine protein kinase n=1 Tax=Phormidium sp. CCY1219 TaxID=2886104 RepID=UPI002D1E9E09|nr:serine/threonine-protein kinase [Phormidium sp. CCY1219]MEB3828006.1 serine/threonine protein kinase [Phormidium sp. CCY1219]
MLESGSLLNKRYKLQRQLSDRPVRQTWLAEDLQAHQSVVVKLLAFGGPMQWEDLKLFEREAQVLEQLNHPQIPTYRDYFSVDEQTLWFALVQEYIPGSTLKELLDRGSQFSPEQLCCIAREVLQILTYLHQRRPQVLHRDIKPSNLLWGEDDRVHLIDFGAVQNRTINPGGTFTVVGTYGYTPLEQFGGQAVPASDLYALGASLIHLLTAVPPAELPQREMRIQWVHSVSANLTPEFQEWIDRLTDPALERRFASANHALEALDALQTCPETSPPVALAQPHLPSVHLYKSPDRLAIEIPSPLELTFLQPIATGIKGLFGALVHPFTSLFHSFSLAEPPVQVSIAIATLGVFLALSRFVPYFLYSFGAIASRLLLLLFSLPFVLLPLLMPLLLILILLWSIRGGDFFERTHICFDSKNFEIERRHFGSSGYETKRGETPQIKEISVGKYEYNNRVYSGIVITVKAKWAIFSRSKKYVFGQQLPEPELLALAQEIRHWLQLS